MARRNRVTKRMEMEALTRARRRVMMTIIKGARGRILIIKLLREQGMSKEASDLRAKVAMRTTIPYLMLKIGFLLLRKIRKTLAGLIS